MIVSNTTIQVIDLTCSSCGHQRHFAKQGLQDSQLYDLDSRPCDRCGKFGATIMLTTYASSMPFKLEHLSD